MEVVENGYKLTEVGRIPEDWNITRIKDIGTFYKGKGIKKDDVVDDGIPCIRYGELYTKYNDVIFDFHSFIPEDLASTSLKLKIGDILFAGSGETREEIGKSAALVIQDDVYAGGDIVVLRPSGVSSEFLGYLLNSDAVVRQKSMNGQGDAVVHIYSSGIGKITIPLPPTLHEQKAIATALSDVDALISSLDKLIEKKKAIKVGAMQELLTGKTRLAGYGAGIGYKDSKVGRIPEDWEVVSIDTITKNGALIRGPFGGALKKEVFVRTGYKVYEQKNAIYESVELGTYYIDDTKFKELQRFEVFENDFILSCSGTIGRLYQIPSEFQRGIINQALLIIRFNDEEYNMQYFKHQFTSENIQKKVIDDTQGGAMKNLVGMPEFKKVLIPFPSSTEEQKAISSTLSEIDYEIESLNSKNSKYKLIKQGMMQELLIGKTRLI